MGTYVSGPLYGEEGMLVADPDLAEVVRGKFDFDVVTSFLSGRSLRVDHSVYSVIHSLVLLLQACRSYNGRICTFAPDD